MSDIAADNIYIPKAALIGAGLLMLSAVAVAGACHATGRDHVTLAPSAVVESRDLFFKDLPTGGIDITDAATGQHVALIQPTTGGFMRGVMRGLVRLHRLNELGPGSSFRLTRWADGRLSIEDPATRERFELEAFGPTNETAFARLLASQSGDAAAQPTGAVTNTGVATR